jgi:hypothetical protein
VLCGVINLMDIGNGWRGVVGLRCVFGVICLWIGVRLLILWGKSERRGMRGFGSRSIPRCEGNALQTAFYRLRKRWRLVWAGKRRRIGRLEARVRVWMSGRVAE